LPALLVFRRRRESKGASMHGTRVGWAVFCLSVVSGAAWAADPAKAHSSDPVVQRGSYLARIGGCHDCHTPLKMTPSGPVPDADRLLSGHPERLKMPAPPPPKGPWQVASSATNTAWAGPWGVSYTSNLTPDEETGLGSWTEATFQAAMRSGRHAGKGRPILPPMPWQNLAVMTPEDLHALWVYLRSIKPVKNHVPQAQLAPPPGKGRKGGARKR
jgi:hypothetical protein